MQMLLGRPEARGYLYDHFRLYALDTSVLPRGGDGVHAGDFHIQYFRSSASSSEALSHLQDTTGPCDSLWTELHFFSSKGIHPHCGPSPAPYLQDIPISIAWPVTTERNTRPSVRCPTSRPREVIEVDVEAGRVSMSVPMTLFPWPMRSEEG